MEQTYLTVTQLSQYLKRKFDQDPYLDTVYLKGEVSNAARNRVNTTMYFSLKDEENMIPAVIFRNVVSKLKFKVEEGMKVFVKGRISTYPKRGTYQIIIDDIQPDGIGALFQALEQLKEKLSTEGLFNQRFKQPLEKFPKRIAVVTSESGAVIQDIYTTVKRRYDQCELVLYPTYVQGDLAINSIVKNIKRADETGSFDTIIVGRGGGSIEDLWAFNDEAVVRAIFEAKTPIISSVGHETDTTLADLVADVRAATPTAAAELAVPMLSDIIEAINERERLLSYHLKRMIDNKQERLAQIERSYIFKQPHRLYEQYIQNVDHLSERLVNRVRDNIVSNRQNYVALSNKLEKLNPIQQITSYQTQLTSLTKELKLAMKVFRKAKEQQATQAIQSLDHLSPLKILGRGYSYTTQEDSVVKRVDEVDESKPIEVHMIDGYAEVTVNKTVRKEIVDE